MELNIHKDIKKKLDYFIHTRKIPHIIFHGETGTGKRTILQEFIRNIYDNDKELINLYVIYIDCGHGKGIKFIRDELKFFARANIHNSQKLFKSIVLLNADKLTIDAQSALRRCIELFSNTTRFFIVVENKYKLLKPILSRFSEIYVSPPLILNEEINLHHYLVNKTFDFNKIEYQKYISMKTLLRDINDKTTANELIDRVTKLYNKGYSGIDILNYIKKTIKDTNKKNRLLIIFNKIRKDIKNEKLAMFFLLNFTYLRNDYNLENISFM